MDPDPAARPNPVEVHLEAQASGTASVYQAARDQHFYFVDGVRYVRRTVPGVVVGECPYPGLAAFGPEQAGWFFGRDRLLAELTDRLGRRLRTGGVQVVMAPSGAGKSSLLRAGLLPGLAQATLPGSDRWPTLLFTPTADPLKALAVQVASLTGADPARLAGELAADPLPGLAALSRSLRGRLGEAGGRRVRVVVVVDQFEELFTLCGDEQARRTFIDVLTRIAGGGDGEEPLGLVVVGVRADFYAACVDHPQLRAAVQDAPLAVGPMSDAELREAVLHPARAVGLDVEDGLVGVLLRDLGATARTGTAGSAGSSAAGRLPLLAHVLRASWRQRSGSTLTVQGYELTGGIQHAVARTADEVYDGLDLEGQRLAQWLFLRLVKIGDGTEDTRRRLSRAELMNGSADPATLASIVDAFTRKRLLIQQRDTVEISHEALLHSWPQLRRWIDTDLAGRLTRQNLEEAAAAWDRGNREPSLLYRGNRLEASAAWASEHPDDLSSAAEAFLRAASRQEERTRRLRRRVIAGITALALLASVTAVFAFRQSAHAQAAATTAINNQISAQALQLADTDPSLAAQLTLLAHRRAPNQDSASRLVNLENTPIATTLPVSGEDVAAVVFNPRNPVLATGSRDGVVRLWNTGDPHRPTALGLPDNALTGPVDSVAFSPDGSTLAIGSSGSGSGGGDGRGHGHGHGHGGTVWLSNITDPRKPVPLGPPLTGFTAAVNSVVFSPDGRALAAGGGDGSVRLWNVSDLGSPSALGGPLAGGSGPVNSVAFSPDGRTVAAGSGDGSVRRWNVSDLRAPSPLGHPLTGPTGAVNSVAFGPDGHTLATASVDGTVRLWDLDVEAAIERICATSSGALTRERWKQYAPQLAYEELCKA
ncbi:WD40 repeat domain-containing protein [Streptomyces sp. ISL-86]|uniref:WD40 repeat domain-containing protein n=1 Tax=Streptomyces sp. ISL-86 TaxID=2819187 RepID=UPI001BEB20DC|nr:WD40 repeat domain-containing protein [Streptomyces sp. ISL-86]MBT2459805.1 hypothetical protein [Streptomyces sp. ISL-86]